MRTLSILLENTKTRAFKTRPLYQKSDLLLSLFYCESLNAVSSFIGRLIVIGGGLVER